MMEALVLLANCLLMEGPRVTQAELLILFANYSTRKAGSGYKED
jgi:hypothetical protein